jgi:16S rRNA (uracil1498-N3)-methyltransferase
MPAIFLESYPGKTVKITGENARYLSAVLRCRRGEKLTVFDGRGNRFSAIILKAGRHEVDIEIIEKIPSATEPLLNITLIQGMLKHEKMDLVIQKTTELGIRNIIPAVTERTQLRDTRKIGRWRKIALEASRQSGRSSPPLVHDATDFSDVFGGSIPGGLIFWEEGGMGLREALESIKQGTSITLAVGPEGGFTEKEVRLAEENGLVITSLGKRILRAETAAIAAVGIVQFSLGDMGG